VHNLLKTKLYSRTRCVGPNCGPISDGREAGPDAIPIKQTFAFPIAHAARNTIRNEIVTTRYGVEQRNPARTARSSAEYFAAHRVEGKIVNRPCFSAEE
jgi:hypothetical protein